MQKMSCWCASSNLIPFNEDYFRCQSCDTLVGRTQPDSPAAFYGPDYWTTRQTKQLGHPDIYQRARDDLSSRAVYWLNTLLTYKQPPGTTLELGSGHGGFSALLKWAGFQATGLEPNEWVSQLAQTTFNIPTLTGPLSEQSLAPETFDAIILLDVLEHLPEPLETLKQCRKLLKSDGILLIQTPAAPSNMAVADLKKSQNPFLKMLLPLEHLYLYSKTGIQQLLSESGFPHTSFEEALFAYDMFLVASSSRLSEWVQINPAKTLLKSPNGRFTLALLDIYQKWQKADTQRQQQHQQINQLSAKLQETNADRSARLDQIQTLTERLKESEADRQARLDQVQKLTSHLKTSEADRTARKKQLDTLAEQLETAETDRTARLKQVQELTALLQESEADRAARQLQIDILTRQVTEAEERTTGHLAQIEQLTNWLKAAEQDRAERLEQVETLTGWLESAETDRTDRLTQVNELTTLLAESETDRAARFEQIQSLTATIERLQAQQDKST